MASRWPLALLVVAVALATGALAQPSELLNHLPPSSSSLATVYHFPDHATKQFPAGDVITAVISAHNEGSKPYNLTAVVASLNSPMDFSMYIQNFTHQVYFKELPPGEQRTLEYKFRIAPQVPTRDFYVALHLIYEEVGGSGYHSDLVFNGTVEVVEADRLVDTEGIAMYGMIVGALGLIGYWAFSNASDRLGIKKAAKRSRGASRKAAAFDEDEWVKGTPYDVDRRKRAAAAAKAASAKQS